MVINTARLYVGPYGAKPWKLASAWGFHKALGIIIWSFMCQTYFLVRISLSIRNQECSISPLLAFTCKAHTCGHILHSLILKFVSVLEKTPWQLVISHKLHIPLFLHMWRKLVCYTSTAQMRACPSQLMAISLCRTVRGKREILKLCLVT